MEYRKYLTQVKPHLLTISAYNPIVAVKCRSEGIFGEFDIAKLDAERNPIIQNQIFWDTIQKRSNCWEKLIEIFRTQNEDQVADLLENGIRNETRHDFFKYAPLHVEVTRREVHPGVNEIFNDGRYEFTQDDSPGIALVINITEYEDEDKNRYGANEDFRYMTSLWQGLGYNVMPFQGKITANAAKDIVNEFLNACAASQPQSCVVFIGSHGENGKICTSDEKWIGLYTDVIQKINDHFALKGKPKLFFIQSCQDFHTEDQQEEEVTSELKDTLISFATQPGGTAYRMVTLGSYFVYVLTRVFMKDACRKEITELLSDVAREMCAAQDGVIERAQMPHFQSYCLRPFYFNLTTVSLNDSYLNRILPQLMECTDANTTVLDKCCEMKILTYWEKYDIEAQEPKFEKNFEFWRIIKMKVGCWEQLIQIFKDAGQNGVANILRFGIIDYPLDVQVKKREVLPGEYFVYNDDAYGLDPDNIGLALVINITANECNDKENSHMDRTRANQEFEYMKELWEKMDYEVSSYNGSFTAQDINKIVAEFLDTFGRRLTPGSCVVFIGIHGDMDGEKIPLSDGSEINLYEDFICKFDKHHALYKKPKLFFVNMIPHFPKIKLEDTLICFCNLSIKTFKFLERDLASFFVRTLTQVFMENAKDLEVGNLLNETARKIEEEITIPELSGLSKFYHRTELKHLYFNLVEKKFE